VLHFRTYGPDEGPPVLALHGVTGHSGRWRVLADALPELRFVAVDLRGHGRSPWTPPWSIEQHLADALTVLDHLGLDRVAVVGHSFGGAIALHLSHAARQRVRRLVLLDPAVGLDAKQTLACAEESRVDETFADLPSARADRTVRWAGIPDELIEEELAEHLVPEGDRWRYRYCPSAAVTAWSEMARPAIPPPAGLPTLLVPAIYGGFVRPRWVRACRAALGDALIVEEVDAGHMVYLECADEVAGLLRPFLLAG